MSDDSCDLLCLDLPLAEKVRSQVLGDAQAVELAARAAALGDP
jgi:hypothetical protein